VIDYFRRRQVVRKIALQIGRRLKIYARLRLKLAAIAVAYLSHARFLES